ncbi:MAG TPA: hypothetical protein PLU30_08795 [Verrucomicrobiae bacterium]|nr:hypothetical protein [Verrucomicrobiae bacterium]
MNLIHSRLFPVVAVSLAAASLSFAADQKSVTYAQQVRPVFEKNCFKCHGPEKQKEGVRFDSLADILSHDKLVRPGDSAGSGLIRVARQFGSGTGKHRKVKATPLTPGDLTLLKTWIDQGAK